MEPKTPRQQLEEAAEEYTQLRRRFENLKTEAFIAGALFGARLGFEAARIFGMPTNDPDDPGFKYTTPEDFIAELEK